MSNCKTITREELYRLVWNRPMRDVAKDFGVSDVGLGKICKRLNVPKPQPGYWQRIAAGYKVSVPSLPEPAEGVPREVVLLFFGYTHCPDACPTTMSKLSRVYKVIGSDSKDVVTLLISLDPDRDTPAVLKSYLSYFHLNSIGADRNQRPNRQSGQSI